MQAQELRKLKPDTVIAPSITSNGAAPVKTLQLVTAGTIVPDEDKVAMWGHACLPSDRAFCLVIQFL